MVRVAFFGTPAFASPTLESLLASPHRVVLVVTQPDRPSGRGHQVALSPVKQLALKHGLTLLQPDRLKDAQFLDRFASYAPDLGVVAAYGRILPADLLMRPRLGFLNVHASLLPRHRGASPVQHAILAGDRETGVTIIRLVPALDAGPMLATESRPIGPDETSEDVERDLARLGATLLVRTVERLVEGAVREQPQDDRLATYAPRLTKADGLIDWTASAAQIHNRVRGLWPWPHAFTFLGSDRLVILRSAVVASRTRAAHPGEIIEARGDDLIVAAVDEAAVRLLVVQPEGRRAMTAREFLAGHHVRPGQQCLQGPSRLS